MNREIRFLICGPPLSGNQGGPALVRGTVRSIQEHLPMSRVRLLSLQGEKDRRHGARYGVTVAEAKLWHLPFAFLRCCLWALLQKGEFLTRWLLSRNPILKEYLEADVILNVTGIGFHEFFGKLVVIKHALWLLPSIILKKPVVVYSQSMGPFSGLLNRFLALFCLNRVDGLVVRGEISRLHLRKLGIHRPIHVLPDVGFLLEPAPDEETDQIMRNERIEGDKRLLVGVTVNRAIEITLGKAAPQYTEVMARFFDYLTDHYGATMALIPHTSEDMEVGGNIFAKMKYASKGVLIKNEYTAEQLKNLIGRCHLFIGSRFHSIVASLSMTVPTMAIGWSHKYQEVMETCGQGRFVVTFVSTTSPMDLQRVFDSLWAQRDRIRAELLSSMPKILNGALSGGKVISELLIR